MKEQLKKYLFEFKFGTKLMFKEFFNKDTNKKQRANMWTFSRLVISFLIPFWSLLSILTANISLFVGSIALTGFGALTDFFDGRSARKHNSFSEYGRLLDQVADKIFSIMIGITLSLFNPTFLLTLLGEGVIVSTNALYKSRYKNLKIKSTQIGRIKQWPLFISLVLGFISTLTPVISLATNVSIILTFLLQIITTVSYIKSNNESVKDLDKEKIEHRIEEAEQNFEKDNEKVKSKLIENKNTNIIETNKTISRPELCEDLRKFKNQLISNETNDDSLEKKYIKK